MNIWREGVKGPVAEFTFFRLSEWQKAISQMCRSHKALRSGNVPRGDFEDENAGV